MEMAGGDDAGGSGSSSSSSSSSGYSWAEVSSTVMSVMFLWSMVSQYLPLDFVAPFTRRVVALFNPFVTVTIDEHDSEYFGRSEAYLAAEAYLGEMFGGRASRLRAEPADFGSDRVRLALDDHEEVAVDFRGAKVWWRKTSKAARRRGPAAAPWSPAPAAEVENERRAYRLTFHRRHRALVESAYLPHVLAEGRAAAARTRERRLFTNGAGAAEYDEEAWTAVKLDHPSTFATLAMDPERKRQIIEDLEMFRDGKEYYASVGKAWKRGYLLYGPPGTGKSTMIAAMAKFLDYNVYDLELTAVKSNTELRRLFIEITSKSIIVIEDIDCSLDLTNKRGKKKNNKKKKSEDEDKKVTLSGLLNTIDGLWSACGGERIIVFTTNHKEKLDPALIRRGRMDMHIEMSYCCFEGFKVLAKNYLGVTEHKLFGDVQRLLKEVDISPADVAENLMARSKKKDVDASLENLVKVLEQTKEAVAAKASPAQNNKDDEDEESDDDDSDDDAGDTTITDNENYHSDSGKETKGEGHKKKQKKGLFRGLAKIFTCT